MRIVRTIILILSFTIMSFTCNAKEIRALWVVPWNLTNPEQIDELILEAITNNQTELLAEVRYRSDALYIPNKTDSTYYNPEPRSYVLKNNDFDPLQYLLERAHSYGLAVQAWLSVLNATPTNKDKLKSNYVYANHNEWIMTDSYGNRMNGSNYLGYFIDPGINDVKIHLMNVILDIVENYPELDGIHLDYIRYPAKQYGYSTESVRKYNEYLKNEKITWNQWRINQITEFIRELRERVLLINSNIDITAAVIADIEDARIQYAQDWVDWVNKGLIDRVYPMAYAKDYDKFQYILSYIDYMVDKEKVVVGLRAWQENYPIVDYSVNKIIDKAKLCRKMGFGGLALFSYEGLMQSGYFPQLSTALFEWIDVSQFEDEEDFLSQITSHYQYYAQADSNSISAKDLNHENYSMKEEYKPKTYFDNIVLYGGKYYISLFFEFESNWKWEILDLNNKIIYEKEHLYSRGNINEEWNGITFENKIIQPGVYIFRVKDSFDVTVNEKKFMVK